MLNTCSIKHHVRILLSFITGLLLLNGCTSVSGPLDEYHELQPSIDLDAPLPATNPGYSAEQIKQGKYLVELLGCGTCHTDGALVGEPDQTRLLAGSRTGIAYSDPLRQKHPGVLFPANLTPDATGLGNWTEEQIMQILRSGIDPYGRHTLSVMPWTTYSRLSDEDARAIVAYLRSLPPIQHKVPANITPGEQTGEAFVHFGIYQKRQ